MFEYFIESYFVTILGLTGVYFWGEHILQGSGLACVFIALVLSILEVSLSFDNAIVNAMKLEKMTPLWRHRFITWGIIIAVFGMRFLFPILVVSIFANISMLQVARIALSDADKYSYYLTQTHAPIVAFGGMFLVVLFLNYFINSEKEIYWIKPIERFLVKLGNIKILPIFMALCMLLVLYLTNPEGQRISVVISGLSGIAVYMLIDGFTTFLEKREKIRLEGCAVKNAACGGFVSFLYLELIDASFSLDGVLGAFALSEDIVIITIGLAIGAMFVRSLTIMLVEKKTLKKFVYLEHGAHWAIGSLAALMLVSTVIHVPNIITGLIGLTFIIASFISSVVHNKKQEKLLAGEEVSNV